MNFGLKARREPGLRVRADGARIVDVARALQRDVVDRAQRVAQRRAAGGADLREHALGLASRTAVAGVERDRLAFGTVLQAHAQEQLIGRARLVLGVEVEQLARFADREREVAADDLALHRMQLELEIRHDAEVAAAAAQAPEKLRVLVGARVHELAVGGHDVGAANVVERQAEAPRDAAEAAAEREARHAGVRHRARGSDEAELHRLVVHVAEQAAARDVAMRSAGSTRTPRIKLKSIIRPPSHVDLPEWLCPPHFTATSRLELRAKSTALRMSATPRGWTISAGNLLIDAFNTRRASS